MELFGTPVAPDIPSDQRACDALIKRIKKLRWMGMHEEEERVQKTLAERDTQRADSVIADPRETD